MTSNLLENVQVYLLSHAVTKYCMICLGNSSKIEICFFRINHVSREARDSKIGKKWPESSRILDYVLS